MNKKQLSREKIAWVVAFIGGCLSVVSLVLLFIVILAYNETLLVISYNLAYIVILVGLMALGLTIYAISLQQAEKDGGLEILRYRSGKLAFAIIVAAFVVIAFARIEVYQNEISIGIRNADGVVTHSKD